MNAPMDRRDFLRRVAFTAAMHAPLLSARPSSAAEPLGPVGIRRLRLKANNLAEQVAFYRDVLRLPVDEQDTAVQVSVGESVIEFTPDPSYERPFYHFAFTIPENQLEAAMAWLEPRCPIANIRDSSRKIMHFRTWNAHSCYFFDPAGNILEFIAHHDLNNGTSKPFEQDQILYVSEIGIVVPDVPAAEAAVGERLGLMPYRGSSDTFAPLGDMHGLLIVCKEDRVWLPTTDVPAQVFPTKAELGGIRAAMDWGDLPYTVEPVS